MPAPFATEVVYLIDDDPSVRRSVARLLQSGGFQVEAFTDPGAFLAQLTCHSIPVAVLDIWMRGMTGMELLGHLHARSPETRAIFITDPDDRAAEPKVITAGAFAFFRKPLNAEGFLDAVRRAFTAPQEALEREIVAAGPAETRDLFGEKTGPTGLQKAF